MRPKSKLNIVRESTDSLLRATAAGDVHKMESSAWSARWRLSEQPAQVVQLAGVIHAGTKHAQAITLKRGTVCPAAKQLLTAVANASSDFGGRAAQSLELAQAILVAALMAWIDPIEADVTASRTSAEQLTRTLPTDRLKVTLQAPQLIAKETFLLGAFVIALAAVERNARQLLVLTAKAEVRWIDYSPLI